MKLCRVLIVDDERPARAHISRLLSADDRFQVAGEACDGCEALEQIDALRPELVFLDVQMPGLNGFEVLDAIGAERSFEVVFSTAYDQYALRAFESHAVDYLLKPYDSARFHKALGRAYSLCSVPSVARGTPRDAAQMGLPTTRTRLTLRSVEGAWITMVAADIVCLLGGKRSTRIVLRGVEHSVRAGLVELSRKLDKRFARTHRSEIVNVDAVQRLEPWTHGDAILVFHDGSTRVLTRTYRDAFKARFLSHAPHVPHAPHATRDSTGDGQ